LKLSASDIAYRIQSRSLVMRTVFSSMAFVGLVFGCLVRENRGER
jgi:hypothetical protein